MSSLRELVGSIIPFDWPEGGGEQGTGASFVSAPVSGPSGLNDFVARLLTTISADGVAIAFRDADVFVCRASEGFAPKVGAAIQQGEGICGACISERETIIEQNLDGELRSIIAAPVYAGERLTGCIAAFATRADAFRLIDIETVISVARHLGEYEGGDTTVVPEAVESAEPPDEGEDYLTKIHKVLYPSGTRTTDGG